MFDLKLAGGLLLALSLGGCAALETGPAQTVPVAASEAGVTEYMLDNGMKVLVKPDHRAPVVVSQVWYKVGSSYEYPGITGLSHVLEHMMFKGTKTVGPGEFSRIIAAKGGSENAFTGRDYTAYFETLSKQHLETALRLEADRMHNLVLDPAEFAKELEVVKEERRLRTEDKPTGLTYENFNAAAWRASPYHNPVIGWMSDLDHMTVDDLAAWYQRWYAPNNATLVVVGDVTPEAVVQLARRHFGPIAPFDDLELKTPVEPVQHGISRVEVRVPARQSYLMMGYKTPIVGSGVGGNGTEDWEPYALYVLSAILDGGSSARFSRELERDRAIAAAADADYSPYSRLPDMLTLDGIPTDAHSTRELEQALLEQVERLKSEPVSRAELDRIVTQLVAGKVFERDSMFYQAMQLGMLETVGLDWRLSEQELASVRAVTPAQVQAVARKYLTRDNLTVGELVPLPIESPTATPRPAQGDQTGD